LLIFDLTKNKFVKKIQKVPIFGDLILKYFGLVTVSCNTCILFVDELNITFKIETEKNFDVKLVKKNKIFNLDGATLRTFFEFGMVVVRNQVITIGGNGTNIPSNLVPKLR